MLWQDGAGQRREGRDATALPKEKRREAIAVFFSKLLKDGGTAANTPTPQCDRLDHAFLLKLFRIF